MSGVDLTKDRCIELLKSVLVNTGWTERADGLWDMPDRNDFFSSSSDSMVLNDAIHINNAIVSLLLPDEKAIKSDGLITPLWSHVEGSIDLSSVNMVCIPKSKYKTVTIAFKQCWGNFPFADIKLHEQDRYADASAVFPDAEKLGLEIVRRWNGDVI